MSRISPAIAAAAHATSVRPGSTCFACGGRAYRGGMWMGQTGSIYVCADPGCTEKLLLLALDARCDADPQLADRHRYAAWLRFADGAYERWVAAEERKSTS